MPHVTKTEAIIVKKKILLQKDVLVTMLTQEQGKISAIAKGIKNITSRRAPHIQTGNLLNVNLSNRGHAFYLQGSDLISAFASIKDSQEKVHYLYTFLFIIDRLIPEAEEDIDLYYLVKSFLIHLAKVEKDITDYFSEYLYKLLQMQGYVQERKSLTDLIRTVEEIIHEKVPSHAII